MKLVEYNDGSKAVEIYSNTIIHRNAIEYNFKALVSLDENGEIDSQSYHVKKRHNTSEGWSKWFNTLCKFDAECVPDYVKGYAEGHLESEIDLYLEDIQFTASQGT